MIKKYSHLFKSNKFIVSLIILIVAIVYFTSFFHGLIFLDDDTLIFTKFSGMGLGEKISFSFSSNYLDVHYYRPMTLLSFILESIFEGKSYFIYHFTNFILHLSTVLLIYAILKAFKIPKHISFLGSLLFGLSPIHVNAVGWIAGRGDLLAAFFSATALLIFMNFIKQNKPYLIVFVSLFLFFAILSKEVALPVPFLFLGLYFIEKKKYELDKNSISVLIMIAVVIGCYYVLRGLFLTSVHIDKFSFTTYYKNILVLPETVSKFFIPVGINALAGIELFTSIAGSTLLILLVILPLILKPINRFRYYWGFLWFILLLLPGMVFRTMGQDGFYYWDCRSYLPAIGLTITISETLKAFAAEKRPKFSFSFVIIYLVILGTITFSKIKLYENPISYWSSVKSDYPSSFLPYVGLFNYYSHYDEYERAERQLLQAVAIRPKELSIRDLLVNSLLKRRDYTKAAYFIRKTLIEDKIFSSSFIEKYIWLSDKSRLNTLEYIKELSDTYLGDRAKSDKINELKSRFVDGSAN